MKKFIKAGAFAFGMFATTAAYAADCKTDVKKDDLTTEQVTALYECIKTELRAGYEKKGLEHTKEYQSWKPVATAPANAGVHGKRFLTAFVNEVGYDEYVKFSDERGPMPVGTVIAKESFNVSKKGKVKKGPLFLMTKVAAGGDADEFGNWIYGVVSPKGGKVNAKQKFCHGCHGNYEDQDSLGYPLEDVRVSSN